MTHAIDSSHSMGGRMVTPPEHFELRDVRSNVYMILHTNV